MATKPAGGSIYGDFTNLPKILHDEPYRGGTTVATPETSYTVNQLIDLINAAVYTVGRPTFQSIGISDRTENYDGAIATVDTLVGGSGYTDGSYRLPLFSNTGSGEGAIADITVASGAVTAVTIVYGGKLYAVDDELTAYVPGGTGFTVDVATLA